MTSRNVNVNEDEYVSDNIDKHGSMQKAFILQLICTEDAEV